MSRQLTIALLKPDIAALPHVVKRVEKAVISKNLILLDRKRFEQSPETESLVSKFYAEHEGKFFHRRCVEYMQSGPFEAWVLAGDNAIENWRELIGKARIFENKFFNEDSKIEHTLRTNFGVTDTRNGFHGSDSVSAVVEEMTKLGFSYDEWNGELEKNREYVFESSFGVHKAILPSGFYADVSETLGLKSTWDRVYQKSETAPKEWFSTSYLDKIVNTWIAVYLENRANEFGDDYGENIDESTNGVSMKDKPIQILDIGCGLSGFSSNIAEMFGCHKVDITACDFSEPLIKIRTKSNELSNLKFVLCDLVNDNLPIYSTDVILDKATIDAIVRQPSGEEYAKKVFEKLLKLMPKMMICVSDEGPEIRTEFLEDLIPKKSGVRVRSMVCENISEEIDSNEFGQYFAYKIEFEYSKKFRKMINDQSKTVSDVAESET